MTEDHRLIKSAKSARDDNVSEAGVTASLYCVKLSERVLINIVVRSGEETRLFKESFPDALPFSHVWLAKDPVAEVLRQKALISNGSKAKGSVDE